MTLASSMMIGLIACVVLFLLIMLQVKIGIACALVGFLGLILLVGIDGAVGALTTTPIDKVASFSFSVIPLFILMGSLAVVAGIGAELYDAAAKWLGRIRGGLAMATTAACTLFAAASGSSLASAATFTKLSLTEMLRYKYNPRFASGCIACSGTFASMIPPSGVMVIYCVFTEVSLGKLLIAGVIPGLITAFFYMFLIYSITKLRPTWGPAIKIQISLKEKLRALLYLIPVFIIVMVIIGGIYTGIFSPTEAGAVGAFTTFLIAVVRKKLNFHIFVDVLLDTAKTTATIFFVIVGAMIFAKFLIISNLPTWFCDSIESYTQNRWIVLLIVTIIFLILGTFLDVVAIMGLTLPILFPLMVKYGFDGIWFGIFTVKMVEIAFITPPLGLNIYVVKGAAGDLLKLEDIFYGSFPFLGAEAIVVFFLSVFPQIALWLPGMM